MPLRPRTALLLGLDEAGYGPFLGPLCVGAAVFRARVDDADKPPCLWKSLKAIVCKTPRQSTARRPRLCVNDSKALKKATGPGVEAHAAALADIELSLLAFTSLLPAGNGANRGGGLGSPEPPPDDASLFERLNCSCLREAAREAPRRLPLNHESALIAIRAAALRHACANAGVEPLGLRVAALEPARFNAECERLGSKAAVAAGLVLSRLRDLWGVLGDRAAPDLDEPPALAYAFLDRQGGRTDYTALLSAIDPAGSLEEVRRSDVQSAYTLRDCAGRRELRVIIEVEADSKRFPVALASMAAKYCRDLAMLRFNERFAHELPEVKPTQGYGTDGRRWITEASRFLTPEQLATIVRQR
jgi:hypothetical protein